MRPEIAVKLLQEAQRVEHDLTVVDAEIKKIAGELKDKKDAREGLVAELRDIVKRESEPLLEDQP